MRLNTLYAAIADWLVRSGVKNLHQRPGLSTFTAQESETMPLMEVSVNPHPEEIEAIPPFNFRLVAPGYFPGLIAIVGPDGGEILESRVPGQDEAGLIAFFEQQEPAEGRADAPSAEKERGP